MINNVARLDDDWLEGYYNGERGIFPASVADEVTDDELSGLEDGPPMTSTPTRGLDDDEEKAELRHRIADLERQVQVAHERELDLANREMSMMDRQSREWMARQRQLEEALRRSLEEHIASSKDMEARLQRLNVDDKTQRAEIEALRKALAASSSSHKEQMEVLIASAAPQDDNSTSIDPDQSKVPDCPNCAILDLKLKKAADEYAALLKEHNDALARLKDMEAFVQQLQSQASAPHIQSRGLEFPVDPTPPGTSDASAASGEPTSSEASAIDASEVAASPEDEAWAHWLSEINRVMAEDKSKGLTIFQRIDRNNDRQLSKKEFIEGMKVLKLKDVTPEELALVFGRLDKNKDGTIDAEEFIKNLKVTHKQTPLLGLKRGSIGPLPDYKVSAVGQRPSATLPAGSRELAETPRIPLPRDAAAPTPAPKDPAAVAKDPAAKEPAPDAGLAEALQARDAAVADLEARLARLAAENADLKAKIKSGPAPAPADGPADLDEDEVYDHWAAEINRIIAEEKQRFTTVFQSMSGVSDQYLTRQEFAAGMQKLKVDLTPAELAVLYKKLDSNNDNRIDLTEFSKGLKHSHKKTPLLDTKRNPRGSSSSLPGAGLVVEGTAVKAIVREETGTSTTATGSGDCGHGPLISELEAKIKALEEELKNKKKSLDDAKGELDKRGADLSEARTAAGKLQANLDSSVAKAKTQAEAIKDKEAIIARLTSSLEASEKQVSILRSDSSATSAGLARLAQLEGEVVDLKNKLAEAQAHLKEAERAKTDGVTLADKLQTAEGEKSAMQHELEQFRNNFHKAQADVDDYKTQVAELRVKVTSMEELLAIKNTKLVEAADQYTALKDEYDRLKALMDGDHSKSSKLELEYTRITQEHTILIQKFTRLEQEITIIKKTNIEYSALIESKTAEITKLSSDLTASIAQAKQQTEALEKERKALEQLQQAHETLKKESADTHALLAQRDKRIAETETLISRLESRTKELEQGLSDREKAAKDLKTQRDALQKTMDELASQGDAKTQELIKSAAKHEATIKTLQEKLNQYSLELADDESKLSLTTDKLHTAEAELKKAQDALQAHKETIAKHEAALRAKDDQLRQLQADQSQAFHDKDGTIHKLQETCASHFARITELEKLQADQRQAFHDKDGTIHKLQETCASHFARIAELETASVERENTIHKLQETCAAHFATIAQQQTELAGKDDTIYKLQNTCANHQMRISEVEAIAVDKDSTIHKLQATCASYFQKIDELARDLADKDGTIHKLQDTCANHFQKIDDQAKALADADSSIHTMQQASTQQQTKITELETSKTALDKARADLAAKVKAAEQHSKELDETMASLRSTIASLEIQLKQKDAMIADLKAALERQEAEVKHLQSDLASQSGDLTGRLDRLSSERDMHQKAAQDLTSKLQAAEHLASQTTATLAQRKDQIAALEKTVGENKATIETLRTQVAKLTEIESHLTQQVESGKQTAQRLQSQVASEEKTVHELRSEIDRITTSSAKTVHELRTEVDRITTTSTKTVTELRQEIVVIRQQAQQQLTDKDSEIGRLQSSLKNSSSSSAQHVAELQSEKMALQARIASLEQQVLGLQEQLRIVKQSLDTIQRDGDSARSAEGDLRARLAAAEVAAQNATSQLAIVRDVDLPEAVRRAATLQSEVESLLAYRASAQGEIDKLHAALEAHKKQEDLFRMLNKDLQTNLNQASEERSSLRAEIVELRAKAKRDPNADAQYMLKLAQEELATMRTVMESRKQLTDRTSIAEHEINEIFTSIDTLAQTADVDSVPPAIGPNALVTNLVNYRAKVDEINNFIFKLKAAVKESRDDGDYRLSNLQFFIATHSFDPSISANEDPSAELSFTRGDLLVVYGDVDNDGFLEGMMRYRHGLVPINLVKEIGPSLSGPALDVFLDPAGYDDLVSKASTVPSLQLEIERLTTMLEARDSTLSHKEQQLHRLRDDLAAAEKHASEVQRLRLRINEYESYKKTTEEQIRILKQTHEASHTAEAGARAQEVAELRARNQRLERDLADLRAQMTGREKSLTQSFEALQQQLRASEEAHHQLTLSLEQKNSLIQTLQDNLHQQEQRSESTVKKLIDEYRSHSTTTITSATASLQAEYEDLQRRYMDAQSENSRLVTQLAEQSKLLHAATETEHTLILEINELKTRVLQSNELLARESRMSSDVTERQRHYDEQLRNRDAIIQRLTSEKRLLEAELRSLQEAHDAVQLEKRALREETNRLRAEIAMICKREIRTERLVARNIFMQIRMLSEAEAVPLPEVDENFPSDPVKLFQIEQAAKKDLDDGLDRLQQEISRYRSAFASQRSVIDSQARALAQLNKDLADAQAGRLDGDSFAELQTKIEVMLEASVQDHAVAIEQLALTANSLLSQVGGQISAPSSPEKIPGASPARGGDGVSSALMQITRIQRALDSQRFAIVRHNNTLQAVLRTLRQQEYALRHEAEAETVRQVAAEARAIRQLVGQYRIPSVGATAFDPRDPHADIREIKENLLQEIAHLRAERDSFKTSSSRQELAYRSRITDLEHAQATSDRALQEAREKHREYLIKYLRAESFRKALVYQKRYLILLLGGFQESEDVTLSMIASMGVGVPATEKPRRGRARARFLAAITCAQAVARLRILKRRWATRQRVDR